MKKIFNKNALIIGVAGGTGSGKTTMADAIASLFDNGSLIARIRHDSYYRDRSGLSPDEREGINYDHPDAIESALLAEHLKRLKHGEAVDVPVYNFKDHTREKRGVIVQPARAIIVEGVLLFCEPELLKLLDIKIFIDTEDDVRFIRRLRRDMAERGRNIDSVIEQYLRTVRPMHMEFVEPSRRLADVIVPEGGNPVAVDMVVAMIKSKLNRN